MEIAGVIIIFIVLVIGSICEIRKNKKADKYV